MRGRSAARGELIGVRTATVAALVGVLLVALAAPALAVTPFDVGDWITSPLDAVWDLLGSWLGEQLRALISANAVFVLICLGVVGVLYELVAPGVGVPGIVGTIALVVAAGALLLLPASALGIALLVIGGSTVCAELFTPSMRAAAIGGVAALLAGGALLFDDGSGFAVSWWVLLATTGLTLFLALRAGEIAVHSRDAASRSNSDALIGRETTVRAGDDGPRARLGGASWRLRALDGRPLEHRQQVRVVDRENLVLLVEPITGDETAGSQPAASNEP